MRLREFITEGGWASTKTQSTSLTPAVLKRVVEYMHSTIEPKFNAWLKQQNIPEIKIGNPVGSGTYYVKHLQTQPDKEYGDIDIQYIIPRLPQKSTNEIRQYYYGLVKQYGDATGEFETENGKNIVFDVGDNQYVQIDLVSLFSELVDWSRIFAPPEGVKGVLSASLYSALGEALNISISDLGVQMKLSGNVVVPYSKQRDVKTVTVTTNPSTWALDIAKHLGCAKIDPILNKYPGLSGETTIDSIVGSIIGLARTLDANDKLSATSMNYTSSDDLLRKIKDIYLSKINKVITSSKFEKADTPLALQKAEKTKQTLALGSTAIANTLAS